MAVATRTISNLAAPFTQAQLSTALQTAFANAGFSSLFDSYTSGTDLILVYAFVVDSSKAFGTTYLRVRISNSFVIYQALYSTWNASTHTGTNNSSEVTYSTLLSTNPVVFNALASTGESRLVFITQGNTFLPLGMIAPAIIRSSWNLGSWNWGFIFSSIAMTALRTTANNQYSSSDVDIALAGNARIASPNTQDNERDILSGLILLSQVNQGFCGKTSDDIAIVAALSSTRYDSITKSGTSQQYLIVNPGSGGIAVRVS